MDSFTYNRYATMLQKAKKNDYTFEKFRLEKAAVGNKVCLLRHDVDNSPQAALILAEYEASLGISSTYFFMFSSETYNCLSPITKFILQEIVRLGHEVALHFSEIAYPDLLHLSDELWQERLIDYVQREVRILADIVQQPIYAVSFHQPSQRICFLKPSLPKLINTYRPEEFGDPFYLSDSCMRWRGQKPEEVFELGYQRIQLLTHPMWWREKDGILFERWQLALNDRIRTIWGSWKVYENSVSDIWKTPYLDDN